MSSSLCGDCESVIPRSPLSAKGVGVSPVLKIGPDREADVSLSFRQRDGLGPPGGSSGEEPGWQCGRRKRRGLDPWVGKTPWRRKWQPTPVFLPRESHGWRSLLGYSPQGRKESDTTKQFHFTHFVKNWYYFFLSCLAEFTTEGIMD